MNTKTSSEFNGGLFLEPDLSNCCSYSYPVRRGYRCPFPPVGTFEGMQLCALHCPLSQEDRLPSQHYNVQTIRQMISEEKIKEIVGWNTQGIALDNLMLRDFEFYKFNALGADISWSILDWVMGGFCEFSHAKFKLSRFLFSRFTHCNFILSDLTGCDLSHSSFKNCTLSEARLFKAKMCAAFFTICDLSGIKASRADFSSATLKDCSFRLATLKNAKFRYSQLDSVDFSKADLTGADFTGAELVDVRFAGTKLKNVKGLKK